MPRNKICQTCSGQKTSKTSNVVTVEIEKGSKDGKQIRFKGQADEEPGYQTGDLIFIIQEEKHKFFTRDGNNLIIKKDVPLVNALTGFSFALEHLDGKKLVIETPSDIIIESDAVLEVADQGMPVANYPFEHGSLFIKFTVIFPASLSEEQISILKTALPGNIPAPAVTNDVEKVLLQRVDHHRNSQRNQQSHRDRATYSSDEEDGPPRGHHGGVQCAQQ